MPETALLQRAMETQNESEKIFERYLDSNGFRGKWTYELSMPEKSKNPDYLLHHNGQKCFFEVKELRKKPNEPTGAAYYSPYSSLRSQINEARKKFKEYKKYSCSLVVYNIDDRTARLAMRDPRFVFGAMLGNLGLTGEWDPEKGESVPGSVRNAFLKGGKMIDHKRKQSQNTTISAIVVLEEFLNNIEVETGLKEEEKKQGKSLTGPEMIDARMRLYPDHPVKRVPRVVVVENPFARIPFPDALLVGPFDERWRWTGKNGKMERVFAGSRLKELEELKSKA